MSFLTIWRDLEDVMLNEVRFRKTKTSQFPSRMVDLLQQTVEWGGYWSWGEDWDGGVGSVGQQVSCYVDRTCSVVVRHPGRKRTRHV